MTFSRICLTVFFLFSSLAFAANTPPAAEPLTPSLGILQVFGALVFVLGAILVTAWALKRFAQGGLSGNPTLRVVGGVMVGPKERVVIVEVGENWLVLGVTAAKVSMLQSLPRPADAAITAANPALAPFAEKFLAALKGRSPEKNEEPK